jgi:hypothetical protein
LIASLPSFGVRETGFWHARQMLGRSESSELAAARLLPGSEAMLVPNSRSSSAKVPAVMFALARTLTGIDIQPNSAVRRT